MDITGFIPHQRIGESKTVDFIGLMPKKAPGNDLESPQRTLSHVIRKSIA
jgi:hypothetical protein